MEDEVWVRLPAVGRKSGCGVTDARENRLFISRLQCFSPQIPRQQDEGLHTLGAGHRLASKTDRQGFDSSIACTGW